MNKVGWRRAPEGVGVDRDARRRLGVGAVPTSSDLVALTTVVNQLGLSSCVANAVAVAVRGAQIAGGGLLPDLLARLALYWLARSYTNETTFDNGSFIHFAFAALNKFGFCRESDWPYTDQGEVWKKQPPFASFEDALPQHAPTDYQRILTTGGARVDDVKRALGTGHLVVFGTDVSEDFCSGDLGASGVAQPPGPGDKIAGGHAMLWCAHKPESVRGLTSWGTDVFQGGYFDMSWDYVEDSRTDDIWIVASAPQYAEAA